MNNNLARGTIFLMFAQGTIGISGYLIHIFLARNLGPSAYGIFGIILTIVLITKVIFLSGINKAVSKFISENKSMAKIIYYSGLKIQLFLVIVCLFVFFFFSDKIAMFFNDSSLSELIKFSSLIILTLSLYTISSRGYLNGLRLFKEQAICEIIHSFGKLFFSVLFIYLGMGIFGVVGAFTISPLIAFFLTIYFIKKKGSYVKEKISVYKKLMKFAFPVTLFYLFNILTMELGLLLVKRLLINNEIVGYFTASLTISKIPYSLVYALPVALLPSISSSIAEKKTELTKKYINKSLRYSILILFPVSILISTHAEKIITFLYGGSYLESILPLKILVFGFTLFSLYMIQSSYIMAKNKASIIMLISLLTLPLAYILYVYFILEKGLLGASIATLLISLLNVMVVSFFTYKIFRTLISIKSLLNISVSSLIIYFLANLFQFEGLFVLISIVLLIVCYLLILFLLGEIKESDKLLFLSLMRFRRY